MRPLTWILATLFWIAASPALSQTATMKTALGEEITLNLETLEDSRGYLYCELLFDYGDKGLDIYSTSHRGECSLSWWNALDLDALAKERGAEAVHKNGPQRWAMDRIGMMLSEPTQVAGATMGFGAHLPAGTMGTAHYEVFNPAKYQNLVYKAGQPVYQLVDPEGHVYVLQGYKVETEELAKLGEMLGKLPEGWTYRVETADEDLVMNLTPAAPIPSVGDELDQYFIRIPE